MSLKRLLVLNHNMILELFYLQASDLLECWQYIYTNKHLIQEPFNCYLSNFPPLISWQTCILPKMLPEAVVFHLRFRVEWHS